MNIFIYIYKYFIYYILIFIYFIYILYILYIYIYILYIWIYIYCYAHCSSSSMSTLALQDLNLIWAALISSQRAKQLLSADWSYNIYIWFIPIFVIFLVFQWIRKEEGVREKSVILEGEGFKKMSFSTNIFFEWPLILEINNFLNF